MDKQEALQRLIELDKQIDNATCWGAWLGAACEERDALARNLGMEPRRLVGGVPLAD